jgi:hypothetical protein
MDQDRVFGVQPLLVIFLYLVGQHGLYSRVFRDDSNVFLF